MTNLVTHTDFDDHERVVFVRDQESGLNAIIAVHNSAAGPASGGVRFWHYPSEDDALKDVLQLSKGMSYKAIMADLPLGGGKAVILADKRKTKTRAMLLAFGRAVDQLGGGYIAAEDVGITTDDIAIMRETTPHVAGLAKGRHASGDPSPLTAHGVFLGLEATVAHRLHQGLKGLRIGILGLGAVGMKLAAMLHEAGAHLVVADLDQSRVALAADQFGAIGTTKEAIMLERVDVFAPCALGGILTSDKVGLLQAKVIAGAANNQLASDNVGELIHQRGILYAPDYVINAGGIINVAGEISGRYDPDSVKAALQKIPVTLGEIFDRAKTEQRPTSHVADNIARKRLAERQAKRRAA